MSFHFAMIEKPEDLPADYVPLVAEIPEVYQLNNSGMDVIVEIMQRANLLDQTMAEPDLDAFWPPDGIDDVRAEEIWDALDFDDEPEPPLTEAEKAALAAYEERQNLLLAMNSPVAGRIPSFKFGSNDGWLVTPSECRMIAAILTDALETYADVLLAGEQTEHLGVAEAKATLSEWIRFNLIAADHGGYRVL